ncbi:hypothetical protein HOO65_030596 [Ceratocystis lukuohia]|uniref:Uncharacterized protein n=1 Tax=Ceratocystis lukuohia TaxID=2019550 RepID=A0ABR4MLE3_9PEZI
MRKYETQQKALRTITDFVDQTVSGNLSMILLSDKHTAKDQIAALHNRFKQSAVEKNKQAREAWKKALQAPKKKTLEIWLNNLLAAHTNLTKLELPKAQNASAVEALLSSVGPIAPTAWVERVVAHQIQNENIIFEELLVQFRQEC